MGEKTAQREDWRRNAFVCCAVIIVVSTGCGGEPPACDEDVLGMCLRDFADAGYDIEALEYAVHELDSMIDEDLLHFFASADVEIWWVDTDELEGRKGSRGFATYSDDNMDGEHTKYEYRLAVIDNADKCADQSYALAHQLLHIYIMQVKDVRENHHDLEWYFGESGILNNDLKRQFYACSPVFEKCVNEESICDG